MSLPLLMKVILLVFDMLLEHLNVLSQLLIEIAILVRAVFFAIFLAL